MVSQCWEKKTQVLIPNQKLSPIDNYLERKFTFLQCSLSGKANCTCETPCTVVDGEQKMNSMEALVCLFVCFCLILLCLACFLLPYDMVSSLCFYEIFVCSNVYVSVYRCFFMCLCVHIVCTCLSRVVLSLPLCSCGTIIFPLYFRNMHLPCREDPTGPSHYFSVCSSLVARAGIHCFFFFFMASQHHRWLTKYLLSW